MKRPIESAVDQMHNAVAAIIQLAENVKQERSPTFSLRRQSVKILIEAHTLKAEIERLQKMVKNNRNAITMAPDQRRYRRRCRSK